MFAVTMLNKKLIPQQWMSLLLLVCGVAAVQLSDVKEQTSSGQIFKFIYSMNKVNFEEFNI